MTDTAMSLPLDILSPLFASHAVRGRVKDRRSGYVYLIRAGSSDLYKVGFSSDPLRRLAELRGTVRNISPVDAGPLDLVARWPVASDRVERLAHKRFAAFRRNGEWFSFSASAVVRFKRYMRKRSTLNPRVAKRHRSYLAAVAAANQRSSAVYRDHSDRIVDRLTNAPLDNYVLGFKDGLSRGAETVAGVVDRSTLDLLAALIVTTEAHAALLGMMIRLAGSGESLAPDEVRVLKSFRSQANAAVVDLKSEQSRISAKLGLGQKHLPGLGSEAPRLPKGP